MATIKLTESKLNKIISEEIVKELNEGAGWDVFKDSVKNGYNYKENEPTKGGNGSFKDVVNGRPNKLKSDYHKAMAGSTKNPKEKLKQSYKAVGAEPGLSGKAKRVASVAGAVGGAVARDVADGAKKGFNKVVSKMKKDKGNYTPFTIDEKPKKKKDVINSFVTTDNPNYDKRGYEMHRKEKGLDYNNDTLMGK